MTSHVATWLTFHQLTCRYQFEVSNVLGSVKGCITLIVYEGEGEDEVNLRQTFESNLVTQEEFGEYVASLHSYNGSTFILQFEVLITTTIHEYLMNAICIVM